MGAEDYVPYIRKAREAMEPFVDGSVDPGDLDIARAKVDEALTELASKLEFLIDEPEEQETLRKIVAALTLMELSIGLF
jgi:hypothetical protein